MTSTYFATCLVEDHDLAARVDLESRVDGGLDELTGGNPSVNVEIELSEELVSGHFGCLLELLLQALQQGRNQYIASVRSRREALTSRRVSLDSSFHRGLRSRTRPGKLVESLYRGLASVSYIEIPLSLLRDQASIRLIKTFYRNERAKHEPLTHRWLGRRTSTSSTRWSGSSHHPRPNRTLC